MERHPFHNSNWQWVSIDVTSEEDVQSLPRISDPCKNWIQSLREDENNNLEMETAEKGQEILWGSIIYHQSIEEQEDQDILHYCLSENVLITSKLDVSRLYHLDKQELFEKLQSAENAFEGYMILLGEIVASFLQDIDAFENRVHKLLWQLREHNNEDVLQHIIKNRHEVLVWKNLTIPIIEIKDAMQEAFGDEITKGPHYTRTCRRINRCNKIIQKYDDEIQQMTDLETVISSYRGNEIVKTLTVITMLFTPIMAWGALWGKNFEIMPELKWKFGYLLAIAIILLSTLCLYLFLKKKNWMGSILKNPRGKGL